MAPASLILLGLLLPRAGAAATQSDERVHGDPSLRAQVEARTRSIYEGTAGPETPRRVLFTTDNLLGQPDGVGTEASAASGSGGERLVATAWSKAGKYSVEYYRSSNGALLFVYETFVYFSDRAPANAWRNFMGLPAWERRSYFDESHAIGYAAALGEHAPAPGSGGTELRERADRLAKAFAQR